MLTSIVHHATVSKVRFDCVSNNNNNNNSNSNNQIYIAPYASYRGNYTYTSILYKFYLRLK